MNKEELLKLLDSLDTHYNEGITIDNVADSTDNRIVFWDYAWEAIEASGEKYDTLVTYQFSFLSYDIPRKNIDLKSFLSLLNSKNINVLVNHEYIKIDKKWHSYFSLEVLENIYE